MQSPQSLRPPPVILRVVAESKDREAMKMAIVL
jgi:hypothetical protein